MQSISCRLRCRLPASDVEKGLLLARETCIGEVLRRGGTADSYVRIGAVLLAQFGVRVENGFLQVRRKLNVIDE
jgi:hypothetical protein